ncbi:hypothetical protein DVH24_013419 [Malus domestica]|uniref:Uncharacterized protein n=1 Tax=Malus domestica TaxID=3750 RepID=A0A498HP37_MALDO|nr:hypothetical protein DVH24_013419 [Malus domestica]
MTRHWNIMFDDVEASMDATLEDKSKGIVDSDQDSKATPSSERKGNVNKGYHTSVEALPSSSWSATEACHQAC